MDQLAATCEAAVNCANNLLLAVYGSIARGLHWPSSMQKNMRCLYARISLSLSVYAELNVCNREDLHDANQS